MRKLLFHFTSIETPMQCQLQQYDDNIKYSFSDFLFHTQQSNPYQELKDLIRNICLIRKKLEMDDHCVTSVENIELKNEDLYLSVENYNRSLPRGKNNLKVRSSIFQLKNPSQ